MVYVCIPELDYLYWADSDHGTVTRIRRDGTGRQTVVEHFESMESIPVDWLPGKPDLLGTETFSCECMIERGYRTQNVSGISKTVQCSYIATGTC